MKKSEVIIISSLFSLVFLSGYSYAGGLLFSGQLPDEEKEHMVIRVPEPPENEKVLVEADLGNLLKQGKYDTFTARCEEILQAHEDDPEILLYVHMLLGIAWGFGKEDDGAHRRAVQHFEHAKQLALKDPSKYRLHLAVILSDLAVAYSSLKKYKEAMDLYAMIAVEYNGVGSGINKDALAIGAVTKIPALSIRAGEPPEKTKQRLLSIVSKCSNADVAAQALENIALIEIKQGNRRQAMDILEQAKKEYPNSKAAKRADNLIERLGEKPGSK